MPKVHVVDYGRGNIASVCRGLERCGAEVALTTRAHDLTDADRVLLPGVGAFGDCMAQMQALGFTDAVRRYVDTGRPLLGICVGMQVLHAIGEEFGRHEGYGFIAGEVRAIPRQGIDGAPHKTPHIGWTSLELPQEAAQDRWRGSVLDALEPGTAVYFVHSFTASPTDARDRLADSDYNGCRIAAAVQRGNITGLQFHPEKSGPAGLAVLDRFLRQ